MKEQAVPTKGKSEEVIQSDTENGGNSHAETLFQLSSLGELLRDSIEAGELVTKRNWWSKKSKSPPPDPREFGIDDNIGSFMSWNKDDFQDDQEMNERNRLNSKLPHILQKQKRLEEFDKAEKVRIAKQDKALDEIDTLLAKLEKEEQKNVKKSYITKQNKPNTKDDMLKWDDDQNRTNLQKPITYHDSLTDSLDKLLEDIEEQIDDRL
ncbi:uncharacterized protein LOC127704983 [Mytilus californianus]|uniref:uncharacterized protein LOC127704983 n=1 Tax=Mytilus californianus TaxID=6549 RepID=UPI0022463EA0|nr:uncharacterized protein LOC127704983 [Mytilus californianus]